MEKDDLPGRPPLPDRLPLPVRELAGLLPQRVCGAGAGSGRPALDPNIEVLTQSEVPGIEKMDGNFHARIKTGATFVDPDRCISCGAAPRSVPRRRVTELRGGALPSQGHRQGLRARRSRYLHHRRRGLHPLWRLRGGLSRPTPSTWRPGRSSSRRPSARSSWPPASSTTDRSSSSELCAVGAANVSPGWSSRGAGPRPWQTL